MKVTDLKENEGIHCPTEEEAEKIFVLMHEAGLRWINGESYLFGKDRDRQKKNTILYPKEGSCGKISGAQALGYKIYPASDFIEEFTRGELVEVSDFEEFSNLEKRKYLTTIEGARYPYNVVVGGDEKKYENGEEFLHTRFKYIRKIKQPIEPKELTLQEVCEKLGYEVKIITSDFIEEFTRGELVEVSDDGKERETIPSTYLSTMEGSNHPYIVIREEQIERHKQGKSFDCNVHKYIRKIKQQGTHTTRSLRETMIRS